MSGRSSSRGLQDHFVQRYRRERAAAFEAKRLVNFLNDLPKYLFEILFVVGIGLLVLATASDTGTKSALTTVALFTVAGYRLLPSFVRASAALNSARSGHRAADLVMADIRESRDFLASRPAVDEAFTFRSRIELADVTFVYPGSHTPAVTGVTIGIPAGSSLALVGSSGSGKSTLVDLILGFQAPSSGAVLVDSRDLRTLGASWQRRIGYVPQDVYLTDGELWENIAYGEDWNDVDQDELQLAIVRAQLGDFVGTLDDGIHATIGERGAHLSGGQRQRIGIARALYRRPQVLVLDEATSALDTITERRVTDTIDALHGEVTVIIVAHRLSTVRHCGLRRLPRRGGADRPGTFRGPGEVEPGVRRNGAHRATGCADRHVHVTDLSASDRWRSASISGASLVAGRSRAAKSSRNRQRQSSLSTAWRWLSRARSGVQSATTPPGCLHHRQQSRRGYPPSRPSTGARQKLGTGVRRRPRPPREPTRPSTVTSGTRAWGGCSQPARRCSTTTRSPSRGPWPDGRIAGSPRDPPAKGWTRRTTGVLGRALAPSPDHPAIQSPGARSVERPPRARR